MRSLVEDMVCSRRGQLVDLRCSIGVKGCLEVCMCAQYTNNRYGALVVPPSAPQGRGGSDDISSPLPLNASNELPPEYYTHEILYQPSAPLNLPLRPIDDDPIETLHISVESSLASVRACCCSSLTQQSSDLTMLVLTRIGVKARASRVW